MLPICYGEKEEVAENIDLFYAYLDKIRERLLGKEANANLKYIKAKNGALINQLISVNRLIKYNRLCFKERMFEEEFNQFILKNYNFSRLGAESLL